VHVGGGCGAARVFDCCWPRWHSYRIVSTTFVATESSSHHQKRYAVTIERGYARRHIHKSSNQTVPRPNFCRTRAKVLQMKNRVLLHHKKASCLSMTMAATVARRQRPCVALTALLLKTILMMLPCHHQAVEVVAGQPRQPKAGGAGAGGSVANHTITTQPDRSSTTPPPPAHLLLVDPSQTYYLKRGDMFFVASQSALNLHTSLPVGSYTVGRHEGEYYLQEILPFDLTGQKLYGDTKRQAERILHTFRARGGDGGIGNNNGPPTSSSSTGVLLAGQKGSGKTLLAKHISVRAAREMGVSTIVINEPWSGERFNAFIQSILQPYIVLFDEFEKVYRQSTAAEVAEVERIARYNDGHHNLHHFVDYNNGESSSSSSAANTISNPSQDAILTLLDGVYPSTMLFLFTVNDKTKLSRNMMNRPGRIYYVLDFAGLEANFIRECTYLFCLLTHTHTHASYMFLLVSSIF
jgi:hypothetical protein